MPRAPPWSRPTSTAVRGKSIDSRSRSCAKSGASSIGGGRRSWSAGATSTWCCSQGRTPLSFATRNEAAGSRSAVLELTQRLLGELRPLLFVRGGHDDPSLHRLATATGPVEELRSFQCARRLGLV